MAVVLASAIALYAIGADGAPVLFEPTTEIETVEVPVLDVVAVEPPRSIWDRLAACESNERWSLNSRNGYYGGLQFDLASWRAAGGSGLPSDATRAEQIHRAEIWLRIAGWRAWPVCSRVVGAR